jgi:hypothetical protein
MSISGIGAGSSSSLLSLLQQRRQELKDMMNAVQSGDIAGAQQSLTSLQQNGTGVQTGTASAAQQLELQGSGALNDLAVLISSVQSGDIGAAQTALTAFQQDQASGSATSDGAAAPQPSIAASLSVLLIAVQSSGTTAALPDAGGNQFGFQDASQTRQTSASAGVDGTNGSQSAFVTDLAGLLQALQSGDTSSAQTDASAVERDLQNANGGTSPAGGHHHHHHHGGGPANTETSTTESGAAAGTSSSGSSDGLLAKVLASYQGDPSSAQVS